MEPALMRRLAWFCTETFSESLSLWLTSQCSFKAYEKFDLDSKENFAYVSVEQRERGRLVACVTRFFLKGLCPSFYWTKAQKNFVILR